MSTYTVTMFVMSLIIGTTVVVSADHWIYAWVGLEINTLAIVPLMMMRPHHRSVEAAIKYFLTQAPASALLLMSALISAYATGQWDIKSLSPLMTIPMSIAIGTKLGLVPTHFWMPDVLQGIPMKIGLTLATWQKIAPMILLYQISERIDILPLMIMATLSVVVGGWGCLGQTQLRKFLAFSSIAHMGWMVMMIKYSPNLMLFIFFAYILVTMPVFWSFKELSTTSTGQLPYIYMKSPVFTLANTLTILSLGGLPPFTGFLPKLFVTLELINQGATTLAAIVMLAALLSLYAYTRLTYFAAMLTPPNDLKSNVMWRMSPFINLKTAPFFIMALLLLPISPAIVLFS
uniref:NADH-ubiquinone oxidoreductase chain 2 n=1 Tax=Leptopelis vermiculatus TaxID=39602 RepID=S4V018_9NEOB|nr:NADH dehydrogenase subunit 2 [Leptopelis vermiculatus]